MRFKGDIIITDPCYICKEKKEVGEYPKVKDYFSYDEKDDYPDYRKMDEREIKEVEKETGLPRRLLLDEWIHKSEQYEKENKKYEEALQEYRKNNISDWDLSNCGTFMEALGIKNYIRRDTLYGDWSCTTYNSDTNEKIGNFCADAGMVGVFLLDEVLKYNPDFEIVHTEGVYEDDTEFHRKGEKWEDDSVSVVGRGNVNFKTVQTGF